MKNKILQLGPWWFFISLQIGFAILYVLAYHFRLERTQLEAANELICIINNEGFCVVMNGRFTTMLSQFSALMLVKSGASLKSIITIYSLHHIFFFHFLSLACLFIGCWRGALIQVVIPVAAIGASFFMWPFAELLYGIGIAFTAFTVWKHIPNSILKKITVATLYFLVFASHPLAVLLMIVLVTLEQIEKNDFGPSSLAPPLMLVGFYLIYRLCFSKYIPHNDNANSMLLVDTFRFLSHPRLFVDVWALLFSTLFFIYIKNKSLLRLIIVIFSFLISVMAVYTAGHSVELYHAFIVVLCLHIVLQAPCKRIHPMKPALLLVGIFVLFNVNRTIQEAEVFTARKELVEVLIEEARKKAGSCFVVEDMNYLLPDDAILKSPSFRHETLLLSGISGNSVVVIDADNCTVLCEDSNFEVDTDDPIELVDELFVDNCGILENRSYFRCDQQLNAAYFSIDSLGTYETLSPNFSVWQSVWVDSATGVFIPHLPEG